MKIGFYPQLAWNGICKNKRMYLPYILTCVGMVMMVYIMLFLQSNQFIAAVVVGCFIIFAVFYAIVYRITSNAYYSIVSGAKDRK